MIGSTWDAIRYPQKGTYSDLEDRVDSGEITREEADDIMEQRLAYAARGETKYDRNGWPLDMRRDR